MIKLLSRLPLWLLLSLAVSMVVTAVSFIAATSFFDAVEKERDRDSSRFEEGKQAALNGLPAESCPYRGGYAQEHWMKGWQAGYLELKGK